MTDEIEKAGGVLGSPARIKAGRPRRKSAEPELSDAEVKRLFDVGVGAEAAKLQADYEAELDAVLRPGLERHYAAELLAREPITADALKARAKLFKAFAAELKEVGCRPLPARSTFVASFLHVSRVNGADDDSLREMASAISYAHRLKNLSDPCADPLVEAVLAARPTTAVEHKSNGAAAEEATA